MSKVRRPKFSSPKMEFAPANGPRKKLLVGSVFASDDELQRRWLDLQLQFFKETTDSFDHAVVLVWRAIRILLRENRSYPAPTSSCRESSPHLRDANLKATISKPPRAVRRLFVY
jgi:hypothetical protein